MIRTIRRKNYEEKSENEPEPKETRSKIKRHTLKTKRQAKRKTEKKNQNLTERVKKKKTYKKKQRDTRKEESKWSSVESEREDIYFRSWFPRRRSIPPPLALFTLSHLFLTSLESYTHTYIYTQETKNNM